MGNHRIAVHAIPKIIVQRERVGVVSWRMGVQAFDAFHRGTTPFLNLLFLAVVLPDLHSLLRSRSALDATQALMEAQRNYPLGRLGCRSARAAIDRVWSCEAVHRHKVLVLTGDVSYERRDSSTPSCALAYTQEDVLETQAFLDTPRRSGKVRQPACLNTARRTSADVCQRWYQTPVSDNQRWYQTRSINANGAKHHMQEFQRCKTKESATITSLEVAYQRTGQAASSGASPARGFVASYRF